MFVWKFGYTPYTLFRVVSGRWSVGRKKSGYPNENFFVFPNSFLSVLEKLKQVQFDKHSIFGIPTFDFFGFIFRIVGWFDLLLRR
jgi:hypothetical protein